MTPEEYLRSKNFKVRNAPGEWQTQCPFCGDQNRYGHLYVNREHGAFYCHRCGEAGSFYALQTKLGDRPEPNIRAAADRWEVWGHFVDICQDALIAEDVALDYLRRVRGLKASTIGKYRLGWVPGNFMDLMLTRWTITDLKAAGLVTDNNYPLFWDRVLIPYLQRDHVVAIRAKEIGGNILQAKDSSIQLFGVDNLRGHSEAFICEGEMDAMFLDQMGYPVVAIPGALSYQEHWNPWFEEAKRVYVALDADEAGRKGAARIEGYLGKRARILELPVPDKHDSTDISEYFLRDLHTKDDFEGLVRLARGQRLWTFADAILERDELLTAEGVKLGWHDLDYAIHPGLLPGQVVIVLAKTGAGKTAFLTQVVHNLSAWQSYDKRAGPAIPTLMLSLEQIKGEIGNRLERIGLIHNPWASREEMGRWFCNFRLNDENRIPPGDLRVLVDEFIESVGQPPKLMIVDYLGYWARSFKGPSRYEQVSDAIMELKRMAKELQVTIIAPHQVSREGREGERITLEMARDSGVIEETGDFVFSLYRPALDAEDTQVDFIRRSEVRMEILKSRHGNVGRVSVMHWAPYSLSLVGRGTVDRRLQQEWLMYDAQAMYDDVLLIHKSGLRGSQERMPDVSPY